MELHMRLNKILNILEPKKIPLNERVKKFSLSLRYEETSGMFVDVTLFKHVS